MRQMHNATSKDLMDHLTKLILRGPLGNRLKKSDKPIRIKVENGRVGDWKVYQVLDALSWMAGRLNMIDGYDGRKPNGLGYIIVYPKGSIKVAA